MKRAEHKFYCDIKPFRRGHANNYIIVDVCEIIKVHNTQGIKTYYY